MIWTIFARCHWQSHDFKGLILEAKAVKHKDFAVWRVTHDGKTLAKGRTPHVLESMRAAQTYAESLVAKEKTKSEIIKEFCEERGIEYKDLPLAKEEENFPDPVSSVTN